MKRTLIFLFILGNSILAKTQYTIDTVYKMKAWTNTWMDFAVPLYGTTSDGHIYKVSFINNYLNGNQSTPDSISIVRVDLTNHVATSKKINHLSSVSTLWQYTFDSLGQFYVGFNTLGREIWKFNFKDSIKADSIGSFQNSNALAYSMSLGCDKNVYFGASSGGCYWDEYNPYTNTLTKHPDIDGSQQYVLSICGQEDSFVYAELGQSGGSFLWAIRKSDNSKVKLFGIPSRFNLKAGKDGHCYVYFTSDTLSGYYMMDGNVPVPVSGNTFNLLQVVNYSEINQSWTNNPPFVGTGTYFDESSSHFYYTANGSPLDSVTIPSNYVRNNIRTLFYLPNDTSNLYFVGDYYGVYYRYNFQEDSSYTLGSTSYNIYSSVAKSDSEMLFGGYPNGNVCLWNKNKIWTVRSQGTMTGTSNPKRLLDFRTATPANFHHTEALVINHGNIVGAGDVIRIGYNSTSIGTYKPDGSASGYDYTKVPEINAVSLANWHDKVLFSTQGNNSKIYVYHPATDEMVDSLTFGNLYNYGYLYVFGETLIGISSRYIYKYDLRKKTLMGLTDFGDNYLQAWHLMKDGTIVYTSIINLSMPNYWYFKKLPVNSPISYDFNGDCFGLNGIYVVRVRNVGTTNVKYDINSPFGRYKFFKNYINP